MQIRKVGVIGAGQMGNGIAHVCAVAGYDVGLFDVAKERIEAGLATINGNLARQVRSGKLSEADRERFAAACRNVWDNQGMYIKNEIVEIETEA